MGSSPSKTVSKSDSIEEDTTSQTDANSDNHHVLHSDSLTLIDPLNNNTDDTKELNDGSWRKIKKGKENYWQVQEKKKPDEEVNKNEQIIGTSRTRHVNERSNAAVVLGIDLMITLPHQTGEALEIDERSPNKIIEDKRLKEEEGRELERLEALQRLEEIEKNKKIKQGFKTSLKTNISILQDHYDRLDIRFRVLKKCVSRMNAFLKKQENTDTEYFELKRDKNKSIQLKYLKEKKAQLLQRLSDIASSRLRQNNPDFAELCDDLRAAKIADNLSDLYDNEWADLLEAARQTADKTFEEQAFVNYLKDILKFCYKTCQHIARTQQDHLFSCLNMDIPADLQSSTQELQLHLKDLQNKSTLYSLSFIKTDVENRTAAQLMDTAFVRYITMESKQYKMFINLCIEITWQMQIHDPPLNIEFRKVNLGKSHVRPYIV